MRVFAGMSVMFVAVCVATAARTTAQEPTSARELYARLQARQQQGAAGQAQTPAAQGGAQGAGRQGAARGPAQAPANLQVLPKDMTMQQVSALMRTFTSGLGVQCDHCHVGGPQDRAKDDNPKKGVARKMIKMMMAINDDFLKDVGEPPAAGASKVTCYTCHRGAVKPLTSAPAGGN